MNPKYKKLTFFFQLIKNLFKYISHLVSFYMLAFFFFFLRQLKSTKLMAYQSHSEMHTLPVFVVKQQWKTHAPQQFSLAKLSTERYWECCTSEAWVLYFEWIRACTSSYAVLYKLIYLARKLKIERHTCNSWLFHQLHNSVYTIGLGFLDKT